MEWWPTQSLVDGRSVAVMPDSNDLFGGNRIHSGQVLDTMSGTKSWDGSFCRSAKTTPADRPARHPQPVQLDGIVVKESRPGWLSLDLPPLEVWTEPLKQLSVPQRKRVETPEFYQLLQREVTRRYLARSRSPG